MPRYTADEERSTADVDQVSVPVAGVTLVYRVEREPTTTGSHTVGRQLVGVTDTTDRDALADARYQARCLSDGLAAIESQR